MLFIYSFPRPFPPRRRLFLPPTRKVKQRDTNTIPRRYDCVTLMFSGIVGFAKYCSENSDAEGAMKIVSMLNELYTSFDALTDPARNPNIYKVSDALAEDDSLTRSHLEEIHRPGLPSLLG